MNNNESTGNLEFEQWANKLEHMSDQEVSYEIYQRILNHSDIDKDSLRLFSEAYEYCIKLINQGKNLEPNLLKIYLQDIKGENIMLDKEYKVKLVDFGFATNKTQGKLTTFLGTLNYAAPELHLHQPY